MSIRAAKSTIKFHSTKEERKEDMNLTIGAPIHNTRNIVKLNKLAVVAGIGLSVAAFAGAIGLAARPGNPAPTSMEYMFQAQDTVAEPMYAVRPDLYAGSQQAASFQAENTVADPSYAVRPDLYAGAQSAASFLTQDTVADPMYAVRPDLYASAQQTALSSEWTVEELAAIYPVRVEDAAARALTSVLSPEWAAHVEADFFDSLPDTGIGVFNQPSGLSAEWLAQLELDLFESHGLPATHVTAAAGEGSLSAEWTAFVEAERTLGTEGSIQVLAR